MNKNLSPINWPFKRLFKKYHHSHEVQDEVPANFISLLHLGKCGNNNYSINKIEVKDTKFNDTF